VAAGGGGVTSSPDGDRVVVSWLATLGVLAIAGLVVIAVVVVAVDRDEVDEARAQALVERAAGGVAVRLQDVQVAVEHGGVTGCDGTGLPGTAVPIPGLAALVCVPVDAGPRSADLPDVSDPLAEPAAQTALARARDRGIAVLSAPLGGPDPVVLMVAPVYGLDDGALGRSASTATVTTRRDEIAGHVVGVLVVDDLVETDATGWRITDGDTELAGSGALSGSTVRADVVALGRRWTVESVVDGGGGWWTAAWSVAILGLLAAGLLGAADRTRRRELRRRSSEARSSEARAAAIRTLAGVVQQSRDLDELLPAVAVQLSEQLDLAGLSLVVAGSRGVERELFVHGTAPDRSARPGPVRPTTVAPGETLALDLHRADRSIAVLRVVAGVPLDAGGIDLLHVVGEMVSSTIVSVRSLEQQQEAVHRLEALDELKTTFLGVASHELRTPATAISGLATLLATRWDDLSDDDRRVFVQRIATNADSFNALVQDLLDFARMERGDLDLTLVPVDLSATVADVLDRLGSVWAAHGVIREIQPGIVVLGDASAIDRIVTNLVSNAVKFSPAESPVTVTVERVDAGHCRLLVDDAGPGVPVEERDKIFVRFFRGAGETVVRTRGVGIGLSVVQDFVQQMSGAVRVEASPAGGARFVVELDEVEPVDDEPGSMPAEEDRDVATT